MKILHVTMGLNPRSGGPTRSVKGLCRALSGGDIDITLLVLHGDYVFDNPGAVKVVYSSNVDDGFIKSFDIVHVHGLWDLFLHRIVSACIRLNVPYVISPRGMLDPWALSVKRWKKKVALLLYQSRDLRLAAAFHATAEAESRNIRAQGLKQPIIIAPNAVDLPAKMPTCRIADRDKTAIFLSRLHPGKGLLTLVEAWARVHPHGWRMKIVGPDSYGHKKDVIAHLQEHGIIGEWEFVDALDDIKKWEAYRAADLLVHPSVSENFGITIVEGLAAGLPVIATKGTPWGELEERKCGWWIDIGVEPLANALKEAISLTDAERHEMGLRGRMLVEKKYTWDAVVKAIIKGYKDILK